MHGPGTRLERKVFVCQEEGGWGRGVWPGYKTKEESVCVPGGGGLNRFVFLQKCSYICCHKKVWHLTKTRH